MIPGKNRFYELSVIADQDIEEIFDYSEQEFGYKQAVTYLLEIESLFLKITKFPELGKQRNEIKQGLRSIPIGEHLVFYRILKDRIRMVRILHASRDIPRYL